jgi:hypothetical protein
MLLIYLIIIQLRNHGTYQRNNRPDERFVFANTAKGNGRKAN